jgi:hypothetical protein
METFCLPLHEIEARFTRSELYMVAWRSQEQHFHFKRKMDKHETTRENVTTGNRRRYGPNDIIPEGLPEKFYAQGIVRDKFGKVMASPGEINLSQVTGQEAKKYMAAIGMPFPEMVNVVPRREP